MPGFSNITGDESIMFADNASYDGTERGGKLTSDLQLWLGSTTAPHVRQSALISSDSSITFAFTRPTSTTGQLDLKAVTPITVATTYTADSGSATPAANNINVLGLSGSKTSGSGSMLTVKSPPFSQIGASATSVLNTGEFVNAAVTRTLPASVGLNDGDLFIFVCTTAGALIIQAVGSQKIRIGSIISSAAGTATSTSIGDAVTLRYNATDGFLYAVSVVGTWVMA